MKNPPTKTLMDIVGPDGVIARDLTMEDLERAAKIQNARTRTILGAIQHLDDAISQHEAKGSITADAPWITREIKKVKVKDSIPEIEWTERIHLKEGTRTRDMKLSGGPEVHQDLQATLNRLIAHLILLCELYDLPEDVAIETAEENYLNILSGIHMDIRVTGITWGGSDEYRGVTLVGRKELSNKKVLNLVAPFTFFEDPSGEGYSFEFNLYQLANNVEAEVLEYLNGKIAPPAQLDLFE
jgi:hypothetical protein